MEVTILGQSYLLSCPEGGESALLGAATRVDREMCAIRDAGKLKARERIAVLAALNLAYELADRPPEPVRAVADPVVPASPLPNDGTLDLDSLLSRIDETLANDGRLI